MEIEKTLIDWYQNKTIKYLGHVQRMEENNYQKIKKHNRRRL